MELSSLISEAVGFAFDLDDGGVVEEAIEDGGGGRDIADEFAPFFEGTVGGHESGFDFVASHDDLEEVFTGFGRKLLDAHVVDDEQVTLEVRETIVRDWNRASLIFWSVSNECAGDNAGFCRSLQEGNYPYWVEATKLVRSLDPSRLVSSADSGHRRTLHSHWTPADADQFDGTDIDDDQWIPGHPEGFYSLLDVLGSNLYVQKPGQNPEATRRFVEMLADYNKPLLITEFGSMSVSGQLPDGHRPDELGGPEYHAAILREAYQALHEFPEIVGCTPWVLMDVRVPMHWRWYNQGSGCFAYGLLDNQYHEKPVFSVVKNEIQRLRERFDESSLNVPIQQKHH